MLPEWLFADSVAARSYKKCALRKRGAVHAECQKGRFIRSALATMGMVEPKCLLRKFKQWLAC